MHLSTCIIIDWVGGAAFVSDLTPIQSVVLNINTHTPNDIYITPYFYVHHFLVSFFTRCRVQLILVWLIGGKTHLLIHLGLLVHLIRKLPPSFIESQRYTSASTDKFVCLIGSKTSVSVRLWTSNVVSMTSIPRPLQSREEVVTSIIFLHTRQ